MLFTILLILHVLVCLFLILVVLLQSGKAADLAGAFGGMGSQTAFGPRGSATLLSKLTTGSAIMFMITSLSLSIVQTRSDKGSKSVLESAAPAQSSKPATTTTIPQPGTPAQPGVQINPGTPGAQPSVTLTDEKTGASRTVPLNIPTQPPPGQQPPAQPQQPAKK